MVGPQLPKCFGFLHHEGRDQDADLVAIQDGPFAARVAGPGNGDSNPIRVGITGQNEISASSFGFGNCRIEEAGHASFLFAFEESHGYLKGNHARDKDAAVGALLFAELAAAVKDRQQTVLEYLDDLYIDVGHHGDRPINKTYPGREGLATIKLLMEALRERPPRTIGGLRLTDAYDYNLHEIRALNRTEPARPLPEPSSDLLIFHSEHDGTHFAARPSGTEPKIKFYLFARTPVGSPDDLAAAKIETEKRLDRMAHDLEQYLDDAIKSAS